MSNVHTIKAHRVQPFNQKLPQNSIYCNNDLLRGVSTSHKNVYFGQKVVPAEQSTYTENKA